MRMQARRVWTRKKILTRGHVEILFINRAVIAVQELFMPVRHPLLIPFDTFALVHIPGSEIKEPCGSPGLFQLVELP